MFLRYIYIVLIFVSNISLKQLPLYIVAQTLKKGFVEYTEKSWVAKTMPNEREKAVEYIRRKEISDDS